MGSLFKLRDYWGTAHREEYDTRSMVCDNIDNDPKKGNKIIVGSFQGWLRVYAPHQKGFEPRDLLIEKDFKMPILQIMAGNFLPTASQRALAVLCPKKLFIVEIRSQGFGNDGAANEEGEVNPLARAFAIRTVADFTLERTSYNMVCGTFGRTGSEGGKGQEHICVQSMDGQLAFFDHNKVMFSRFIPSTDFLIPGHLLYLPGRDVFLTNSSTNMLHCYRYSTFANSTGSETKDEGKEGRKLQPDWSFNLGEDVMDMTICRVSRGLSSREREIAVLCERTLFVLKEDGTLRFNRRLDVAGATITAYALPDGRTDNLLIGTHHKTVMVYSDKALLWAATTTGVPLRIAVSPFCGVEGFLVVLHDDGRLSANYLGTDPAANPIQLLESKDLDYDAMDAEHRQLQTMIRKATTTGVKAEPKDLIATEVHGPVHQPGTSTATGLLMLQYTGAGPIADIVITIVSSEPITPEQRSTVIPSLPAGESLNIPLSFTVDPTAATLPTSLLIEVFITYTVTSSGDTLTSKTQFLAPLTLVGAVIPVVKTGGFKVQIDTNKDPPHLKELFPEFAEHPELTPNILSFQYSGGGDASILVSKNGGRYRVQASTFECLWLMTSELVRRLKTTFRRDQNPPPLRIDYADALPMDEYYAAIDAHFAARGALTAANESLATVAAQFRAIQKRLLVKFRDRTPMPLASFETLFEGTYRQLYAAAEAVGKAQETLARACNGLSCGTHLVLLLVRYKHQDTFTPDDFEAFKSCLTPMVTPLCTASGWEETVDAMLTYLLRTTLSKAGGGGGGNNARDIAANAAQQPLAVATDTMKLKKHLALVLDRIAKGGNVADPNRTRKGGGDGSSLRSPRGAAGGGASKRLQNSSGSSAPPSGPSSAAASASARPPRDIPIEILESKRPQQRAMATPTSPQSGSTSSAEPQPQQQQHPQSQPQTVVARSSPSTAGSPTNGGESLVIGGHDEEHFEAAESESQAE